MRQEGAALDKWSEMASEELVWERRRRQCEGVSFGNHGEGWARLGDQQRESQKGDMWHKGGGSMAGIHGPEGVWWKARRERLAGVWEPLVPVRNLEFIVSLPICGFPACRFNQLQMKNT